jgi:hypothetical protein
MGIKYKGSRDLERNIPALDWRVRGNQQKSSVSMELTLAHSPMVVADRGQCSNPDRVDM